MKKSFRKPQQNGWIYVHLEGSPAEIGYQHGYLLAAEIEDAQKTIALGLTHDSKKDWAFFRKAAEKVLWPHIEPEYREELKGIVEGLKAKNVKLDIWDVVALNAWLELSPYYTNWYDKQHKIATAKRAGSGALQRVRGHRQLHQGRQGRHRAQQLDRIQGRLALEHHLRHRARARASHS